MKLYRQDGSLLKVLGLGTASQPLSSFSVAPDPWDPSAGPLVLSQDAWSVELRKDELGLELANGVYLVVLESLQDGALTSASKNVLVLNSVKSGTISAQLYPNPATGGTQAIEVAYTPALPQPKGEVFNAAGEKVGLLIPVGPGRARWDVKDAANGVYLVALHLEGQRRPHIFRIALAR